MMPMPFDALRYVDLAKLAKAPRATVELGVVRTPAGTDTLVAEVRRGEIEPFVHIFVAKGWSCKPHINCQIIAPHGAICAALPPLISHLEFKLFKPEQRRLCGPHPGGNLTGFSLEGRGHLAGKSLSDNEVDDRLKAARELLGDDGGETVAGNTALDAARKALHLISLGLIKAGLERQQDP